MSRQDFGQEDWADAVSDASRHVEERTLAEEEATVRASPKRNAAAVLLAFIVLAAVAVWDVRVLTRAPDPPSARQQEMDLRWLVADVAQEAEDFRATEGLLPDPADLLDLLWGDMVYELRDGGYVVLAEGDGIRLEFDGNQPLAEWVALGSSEVSAGTTR